MRLVSCRRANAAVNLSQPHARTAFTAAKSGPPSAGNVSVVVVTTSTLSLSPMPPLYG
jgi:hypothetical protein